MSNFGITKIYINRCVYVCANKYNVFTNKLIHTYLLCTHKYIIYIYICLLCISEN